MEDCERPKNQRFLDLRYWEAIKGTPISIKAEETLTVNSELADREHCYLYYKTRPYSFYKVPPMTQLDLSVDQEYALKASGEKEGNCQVALAVIAYSKSKKEFVYFIPLNERKRITFESPIEKVIFCIRVEGPGKAIIREIKIQEMKKSIHSYASYPPDNSSLVCSRPDIKAACILDSFSYECFKYECSLDQLNFGTWKQQIDEREYDFLFVESAWDGLNRTWRNHFNKYELFKVVKTCHERGLPTVYWGKDDPADYERFIEIAQFFDFIFTTDENCISRYQKDLGHNRVYLLPFAAQPQLHNPIEVDRQEKGNIAFAGAWYGDKFPERNKDLKMMLNAAKELGLDIYDRNYPLNIPFLKFPEEYTKYIVGFLDYQEMVKAYKRYRIFLNVNSVKDSPTMSSRRVFEILASGTVVVSSYSQAIEEMFQGIIPMGFSQNETKEQLLALLNNPEYARRLRLKGLREIHLKHLYEHRFNAIIERIGFKAEREQEGVSVIVCTQRPLFMDNVLENYSKQEWGTKELIVILNNDEINIRDWQAKLEQYPNSKIYQLSEQTSLGECLNYAVKKTSYNYIAKFDDDDYYGPCFLTDLMHAFNYTEADIVGKLSHYAYLESMKALVIRFPGYENRYTNFLTGSFLVKKAVFKSVSFDPISLGEIFNFMKKCRAKGFKIYSADRYNYVYVRRVDYQDHSWKTTVNQLLGQDQCSIIAYTEDYKTHVTV